MLLLFCDGAWALAKRPETGLLAGLWEFPNLPGELSVQEAMDAAAAWGCRPAQILRRAERKHVFTHLDWHLPACVIECGVQADGFIWSSLDEIRARYSLPTAFRQFLSILEEETKGDQV